MRSGFDSITGRRIIFILRSLWYPKIAADDLGENWIFMVDSLGLDEVDRTVRRSLPENARISLQKISGGLTYATAFIQFRLRRMKSSKS